MTEWKINKYNGDYTRYSDEVEKWITGTPVNGDSIEVSKSITYEYAVEKSAEHSWKDLGIVHLAVEGGLRAQIETSNVHNYSRLTSDQLMQTFEDLYQNRDNESHQGIDYTVRTSNRMPLGDVTHVADLWRTAPNTAIFTPGDFVIGVDTYNTDTISSNSAFGRVNFNGDGTISTGNIHRGNEEH